MREQQLQELHKKMALVEGEIATTENDRRQFDGAVKRGKERESELKLVLPVWCSVLSEVGC